MIFTFYFTRTLSFQITGQYSVLLPDGRVQTVTYSVRPETGFVVSTELQQKLIRTYIVLLLNITYLQAEVTYTGEAQFGPGVGARPGGGGGGFGGGGGGFGGGGGGGLAPVPVGSNYGAGK